MDFFRGLRLNIGKPQPSGVSDTNTSKRAPSVRITSPSVRTPSPSVKIPAPPKTTSVNTSSTIPGASITTTISKAIVALDAAVKSHDIVKTDEGLPETFHKASLGLPNIKEALETAQDHLPKHGLAAHQSSISSLEACEAKAHLSQGILERVARAPEASRPRRYQAAVRQVGKGETVEALVIGMMQDICDLAKDSVLESEMEDQIKEFCEMIEELGAMEPSVPDEQSGNTFSNFGSGKQFNSLGGTQNNNTGSGNQFPGASFGGTVHFGSNPS
ncbi:hypothetical protein B0T25DRAFT_552028 [Lasiosphaeria hispida]|uniref:NACHT-NTPase and P-loop NTPases N-terminal domain-containing protein n=1 Tax=Lasiosphaeria hispida TaxID=260671 RepID=A0AAJ0HBA4_9PEZI|nr:hypothetical protein B0T25DRAFT_552028 [Lasiosphaeria hispida]